MNFEIKFRYTDYRKTTRGFELKAEVFHPQEGVRALPIFISHKDISESVIASHTHMTVKATFSHHRPEGYAAQKSTFTYIRDTLEELPNMTLSEAGQNIFCKIGEIITRKNSSSILKSGYSDIVLIHPKDMDTSGNMHHITPIAIKHDKGDFIGFELIDSERMDANIGETDDEPEDIEDEDEEGDGRYDEDRYSDDEDDWDDEDDEDSHLSDEEFYKKQLEMLEKMINSGQISNEPIGEEETEKPAAKEEPRNEDPELDTEDSKSYPDLGLVMHAIDKLIASMQYIDKDSKAFKETHAEFMRLTKWVAKLGMHAKK